MSEIAELFNVQKTFFATGKTIDHSWRKEQLHCLKSLIEENENELLESVNQDLHKNALETYTSEIGLVIVEIDFAIRNLEKWSKAHSAHIPLLNKPSTAKHYPVPFGSVLIIGPWNYPVALLLQPLVSAIAAGNCAVLKPSENAPVTAALLKKLIKKKFNPEIVSCFMGDALQSANLIECGRPDKVFFTGGSVVGKMVMKACAENITPVALELGGCCPCIVEPDVPVSVTARRIIWGKFFNAGQTCVAPNICYVNSKIKDSLITELCNVVKEFYGSDPEKSPDFARIINEHHFDRLENLFKSARAKIICGGTFIRNKLYIAPTVLDITNDYSSPYLTNEIFGPVLPIVFYDNLENVLSDIRKRPSPLTVFLFTKNGDTQALVRRGTVSGNICINGTLHIMMCNELPFGGVGLSGMGRYHGKAGFDTFSYNRSELVKTFFPDFKSVFYPPYNLSLGLVKKGLFALFK
jgi:aldehyde dehydrogenase (NAD+)